MHEMNKCRLLCGSSSSIQSDCAIVSSYHELLARSKCLGRHWLPGQTPNTGGGRACRDTCALSDIPQFDEPIRATTISRLDENLTHPLPSNLPSGAEATLRTQP
jgi:hypothetical protein